MIIEENQVSNQIHFLKKKMSSEKEASHTEQAGVLLRVCELWYPLTCGKV